MKPHKAMLAKLRPALARHDLLEFAKLMVPNFDDPPHIRLIADLLQQIEEKKIRRLAVSLPVRHGKSTLASQAFPAWHLGRNPRHEIILGSHSDELSVRNSRIARDMFRDAAWPFPTKLSEDSVSAGRWHVAQGGSCYAVGSGSSVTGRGADMLLLDDVNHDGLSESEKEMVWQWYTEVALPRLNPHASIVVVGARFAEDDLIGRILASADGPNFKVVNLPAIAGEGDALGRPVGAALWPARYPIEEIESQRVSMSSRAFASQFQQAPPSLRGGMFKREWFQNRAHPPLQAVASYEDRILAKQGIYDVFAPARRRRAVTVMAVDVAAKTGVGNDWTCACIITHIENRFYLLEMIRKRVEFPDLCRLIVSAFQKYRPRYVAIESASSGIPAYQTLQKVTNLPLKLVPAIGSKASRADAISHLWETSRVFLPPDGLWVDEFIDEMCSFGHGAKFDDQLDASTLALAEICTLLNNRSDNAQAAQARNTLFAR